MIGVNAKKTDSMILTHLNQNYPINTKYLKNFKDILG